MFVSFCVCQCLSVSGCSFIVLLRGRVNQQVQNLSFFPKRIVTPVWWHLCSPDGCHWWWWHFLGSVQCWYKMVNRFVPLRLSLASPSMVTLASVGSNVECY